jgi:hypothetical protein
MYPIYITLSGLLDYFFGDALLVQDFLYGSPREVLRLVLSNGMAAIPFSIGLFLVTILPLWFLLRRFPWLFYFIMLAVGALLGFYFFHGGLLSTVAVAIMLLIVTIITDKTLRVTVR